MPKRLDGKDKRNIVTVAVPMGLAVSPGALGNDGTKIGKIKADRLTNSHIELNDGLNRSIITTALLVW